ncbi:hypothetical protein [Ramlibacter sp. AN1133]|uniref:hypothetical protein n=1 Tax=Ramlibacter sp. AN1133 TaxID=3133429 RepID=UPI0030BF06B4
MELFTKAPLIGRNHGLGVWAEGDQATGEADRMTFSHGVASFGYLLQPNERLTGAQWMHRIRSIYSAEEPRTRAVLEAISRVMMVPRFRDDRILYSPSGEPAFRGRLSQCQTHANALSTADRRWAEAPIRLAAEAPAADVHAADVAVANLRLVGARMVPAGAGAADLEGASVYELHPFLRELGPVTQLAVFTSEDVWHQQMSELAVSAALEAGGHGDSSVARASSAAGERDPDVALRLAATQARFGGYASVLTFAIGHHSRSGTSSLPEDADLTVDSVQASLRNFLESLQDNASWSPDVAVFLGRPAPLVNPSGAVQPFERMFHPGLIGWQLPKHLVEHLVDTLQPRSVERERG